MTDETPRPEDMASLDLVRTELDLRRTDQDRKSSAIDGRAGLILGIAGVLIGLSADDPTVLQVLSQIVAALAAAVAGSALWPRVSGAVGIRPLRQRYLMQPEHHTRLKLLDTHILLYEEDEKRLEQKFQRLKISVGVLGVAVALMLSGSIVSLFDEDEPGDPCRGQVVHQHDVRKHDRKDCDERRGR